MLGQNGSRTLILVQTASCDPWLTIENEAQRSYLKALVGDYAEVRWVSGKPLYDKDEPFEKAIQLLRFQLKVSGSPRGMVRRTYRHLISRFRLNAFGQKRIRREFYERFAGEAPLIQNDRIQLPFPNQIHAAGWRTIETYRYLLANFDFDFLLKITSTMLVQPIALKNLISSLKPSRVFAGVDHPFARESFKSGAGLLFSRDVVEGIVANESKLLMSVYEDVAISFLIRDLQLAEEYKLTRVNVPTPESVPDDWSMWRDAHLIRCKPESREDFSRRAVENMRATMTLLEGWGTT